MADCPRCGMSFDYDPWIDGECPHCGNLFVCIQDGETWTDTDCEVLIFQSDAELARIYRVPECLFDRSRRKGKRVTPDVKSAYDRLCEVWKNERAPEEIYDTVKAPPGWRDSYTRIDAGVRAWELKQEDDETLSNAYRRELDPTPVTEEFAKSMATEVVLGSRYRMNAKGDVPATFLLKDGEALSLMVDGNIVVMNATLGDFWTAVRFFRITVKEPS